MKEKKSTKPSEPAILRNAMDAGIGRVVTVRDAKAHLSALLDWVAAGNELVITSNGKPKAKLISVEVTKPGKVFQGMGDYLSSQPIHRGLSADEAVRQDRDGRS